MFCSQFETNLAPIPWTNIVFLYCVRSSVGVLNILACSGFAMCIGKTNFINSLKANVPII